MEQRNRMKQVLIMRYMHEMTLEQCAQVFGLTRERVRQIETRAIRIIRSKPGMMQKLGELLDDVDSVRG